jgi:hypothetical protein
MTTLQRLSLRGLVAVMAAATGRVLGCTSDLESPRAQGPDGQAPLLEVELLAQVSGYDVEIVNIGAITVDEAGRIHALDTGPASRGLVVLGPDGQTLTRFGRSGEGPGEFRSLGHTVAWLGDIVLA